MFKLEPHQLEAPFVQPRVFDACRAPSGPPAEMRGDNSEHQAGTKVLFHLKFIVLSLAADLWEI